MAMSRRGRKQSWVGVEDEKPYAYLREAMVKKLLKGICEPQNIIEDYQHRQLFIQDHRKDVVAKAIGRWDFCGHDFTEDELVYAGYYILSHALKMEAAEHWRLDQGKHHSLSLTRSRSTNGLVSRLASLYARLSSRL